MQGGVSVFLSLAALLYSLLDRNVRGAFNFALPGNSPICMKIQRVHGEIRDTETPAESLLRISRVVVNYLHHLNFFFFLIVLLVRSSNLFGDRGFYRDARIFCSFNLRDIFPIFETFHRRGSNNRRCK